MFQIICLFVFSLFLSSSQAADCESYENNIFCPSGATSCVTCQAGGDDNVGLPCDGVRLNLFSTDLDFCGWCPDTCVPYIEEGGRCWETISGTKVHGMCGPHLTCEKRPGDITASCVRMKSNCLDAQEQYDQDLESGVLGMNQDRPVCDEQGYWGPVQCTGSDVCRCVNKRTGDPIHGIETNMTVAVNSMTCGCAREAEELKEIGCGMKVQYNGPASRNAEKFKKEYEDCMNSKESYFPRHLRCSPNGNFDVAQCIEQTTDAPSNPAYELETCFCYHEGKPFNSSLAPINIAHIVLDCHRPDEFHFEGFYRPCEKKHVERKKIELEHEAENTTYISTEWLEDCDIDGFFSKVQRFPTNQTFGFCSDKFGNPLESFSGIYDYMDCECAVVRNMTSQWGEKPICTVDGSYKNYQCEADKCYCVDRYGRQCEQEEEQIPFNCRAAAGPVEGKAPDSCTNKRKNSWK